MCVCVCVYVRDNGRTLGCTQERERSRNGNSAARIVNCEKRGVKRRTYVGARAT